MSTFSQEHPGVTEELARLEALPQPLVAHRRDLAEGQVIELHHHRRAQLLYASAGVMTITTAGGSFVVPPHRGLWVPGGVEHRVQARTPVAMRTLYLEPEAAPGMPGEVRVLQVTPLLRELILAMVDGARDYAPDSPGSRVMAVILDQLRVLPAAPLSLPVPADPRLRRLVEGLMAEPGDARGLDAWAREIGSSERTLSRLFAAQTGMTFRAWRQQRRLLRALELLAGGVAVTAVALELGYESTSAFTAMFRRALGTSPTRYFDAPAS